MSATTGSPRQNPVRAENWSRNLFAIDETPDFRVKLCHSTIHRPLTSGNNARGRAQLLDGELCQLCHDLIAAGHRALLWHSFKAQTVPTVPGKSHQSHASQNLANCATATGSVDRPVPAAVCRHGPPAHCRPRAHVTTPTPTNANETTPGGNRGSQRKDWRCRANTTRIPRPPRRGGTDAAHSRSRAIPTDR